MSWDVLNTLLNQSGIWSPATLQLMLDTANVPGPEYCRPGRNREGQQGLVADLAKVRSWLRRGASLVLNNIDTLTPALRHLAAMLANETGGATQANLYCSWRAHPALNTHFDTHDVFALHIAGRKGWRIYQRHFEAPINHPSFKNLDRAFHDQHKGPVSQVVDMRAGDVLYMPRGFYHDAIALDRESMHLALAVVPVIGMDLITALFDSAVTDSFFRRSIPHPVLAGEAAVDAHLDALLKRLGELGNEPSFRKRFRDFLAGYSGSFAEVTLPDDGAQ
jgi:ribosomal protein L16 Arg81 hydroxylase